MGVTELKYNASAKALNVSLKLFTNDLETTLKKNTGHSVDLLNPINLTATDSLLTQYITPRLKIITDNKIRSLNYIGYEKEEGLVWVYFEVKKIAAPKTITVSTKLLYEYFPHQFHVIHVDINGKKKSAKVSNPEEKLMFDF